MRLRLHAFEPRSRANGPGLRAVVWFQGCTLGCPGCFNPGTHAAAGGVEVETRELAEDIRALASEVGLRPGATSAISGVTLTGGEPLEQPEAALDLLERIADLGLGVLLFTGRGRREVEVLPLGPRILARVDVAVFGHYVEGRRVARGLLGSANQEVALLTSRHSMEDLGSVPPVEAIVRRDGTLTWTGIGRLETRA